ncbi:helix-turn-helix domain-containing protein [Mucilaginibacter lacusdianchii]|uniref:helix-turn-helix domain-containing protein n=1 Tax=Mucilaginibacter lacusdianchii TaxID=2684211 RepID=UPI00131D896C|nr:helix-turn-helix transcriptional regulator [Mucilaginibacter sp. JXJ CY 39]
MEQHYGQIVEKVIRRNGYSLTELARLTNVNRRSVYNWFNQRRLKKEIIYRIGCALKHDFSVEFPNLFSSSEFKYFKNNIVLLNSNEEEELKEMSDDYWKDKYIALLEKYNNLLLNSMKQREAGNF